MSDPDPAIALVARLRAIAKHSYPDEIADMHAAADLLASLGRETLALRALAENWRAKAERIAVNGKGTRVEGLLMNRAATFHECADELGAALASPSVGHSPNCASWRGVSAHPESEPLPCDCALASPSGAKTP